ncbi:MAG: YiiX/YebB-like N1pC/P60 family cysteine hydrolase [Myxococcales bacterium]
MALGSSCKRCNTTERPRGVSPSIQRQPTTSSAPSRLQEGDLIFQESTSRQSEMVRALTDSRWTHMGVIFNEPTGPIVLEAASPVRKTPLQKWIVHGRERRYVIKRLRNNDRRLSIDAVTRMRKLAEAWLGRPYDLRFRWDDQTLYCSELAYKLFDRAAGIQLGKLERAADMNLDDERVQQALRKRFAGATFDPTETVVTPDSIFNDDQLVEVELWSSATGAVQ